MQLYIRLASTERPRSIPYAYAPTLPPSFSANSVSFTASAVLSETATAFSDRASLPFSITLNLDTFFFASPGPSDLNW